jgi:hypothetical protein
MNTCNGYKKDTYDNIIIVAAVNNIIMIVTYRPIVRQRLGTHTPAEANPPDNRMSKHASLTIETVFSAWSVQSDFKEVLGSIE